MAKNENKQEVATPAYPDVAPVFEFEWDSRLLQLRRIYTEAEQEGVAAAMEEWQKSHSESAALDAYELAFGGVIRHHEEYGSFDSLSRRPASAPPLLKHMNYEDVADDYLTDGYPQGYLDE